MPACNPSLRLRGSVDSSFEILAKFGCGATSVLAVPGTGLLARLLKVLDDRVTLDQGREVLLPADGQDMGEHVCWLEVSISPFSQHHEVPAYDMVGGLIILLTG